MFIKVSVIAIVPSERLTDSSAVYTATFYAAVSASFTIEQEGLPVLSEGNQWNGDSPRRRLEKLRARHTQLETLSIS